MAGTVVNRADQDLPRGRYDFAVIGGGLLGLAAAFYLRTFSPQKTVLLVEQDGIPSEEGETHFSPAIHHGFFPDEDQRRRAAWWSRVLADPTAESRVNVAMQNAFAPVGYLTTDPAAIQLAGAGIGGTRVARAEEFRGTMVDRFFRFAPGTCLALDPAGGCGNAEAMALHYGHGAVVRGLDLCLNSRAAFDRSGEIRLDRLTVNNRMQVEVARQSRVKADALILAAGAATGSLIEHQLGELTSCPRYFAQFPRIDRGDAFKLGTGGGLELPVVSHGDITIRPHHDGALVIPSPLAPDPDGYIPRGGRLTGVNVGVRKELITRFVSRMDEIPALTLPSFNLGKAPRNLRGAWEALTPSGAPEFWRVGDLDIFAVVGGPLGFSLGPAAALALAAKLTDSSLPWN